MTKKKCGASTPARLQAEPHAVHACTENARDGAHSLPASLQFFDALPDSALVDVKVVAGLFGVSIATVWRRAAAGILPKPERIVGTTRWSVGKLRAARNAPATPGDSANGRAP